MTKPASTLDASNLKAANNAYYSALSKRDLQAMERSGPVRRTTF